MPANRQVLEGVAREIIPSGAQMTHLGTGGFACTFKVEGHGDAYALKVIDPDLSEIERVNRELSALQRVNHPGVVPFIDHGEQTHDGVVYMWIKMKFVKGQSLREELTSGRTFSVLEALVLTRNLVDAAAAIWNANTAHRDLTPGNILLTENGIPVIVDLGLARHVDDETLTALPTPGTPGWMSPEQVGATPTHGDWRSDQFVLGALAYLFLTGSRPFDRRSIQALWIAPALETPTPMRELNAALPSHVAAVVERMMHRQPHRRFLRPADLVEALDEAIRRVEEREPQESFEKKFFVNISQAKNFAEKGGLGAIKPHGVVVDLRAGARVSEFVNDANSIGAFSVIDPVTHFVRSPEIARPETFNKIKLWTGEHLTRFADDAERTAFCARVLNVAMVSKPNAVIAPYFYAAEGELAWIHETLACAAKFQELMALRPQDDRADVWTGLAVHSSWLSDEVARDSMLAAVTGQPLTALHMLFATTQSSSAPLSDLPTLVGARDVIEVMNEARVPLVVGKRASSGLLLLALGAAGWTTGVDGNLMNMTPHPEVKEDRRGKGLDRVYVPQLLNSVAVDTYVLMKQARPELVALNTPAGRALLANNPSLEGLSTNQRILLKQHNLISQRMQVEALAAVPAGNRTKLMRELVATATANYEALPPARIPSDSGAFLHVWASALG